MAAAESQGWAYAMGVLHGAHTTTTPDPPEPGTGDSQSTHLVSVLCVAIEDEVQHAALVGRDGAVYNGGAVNVHVHQQTGQVVQRDVVFDAVHNGLHLSRHNHSVGDTLTHGRHGVSTAVHYAFQGGKHVRGILH